MSLRYLVRRSKPEDFSELKNKVPNLDDTLGKPDEDLKRTITVKYSPVRFAHYTFFTKKSGETDWKWVCPSIELDVENEHGLAELLESFKAPWPSHLPRPS